MLISLHNFHDMYIDMDTAMNTNTDTDVYNVFT